MKKAIIRTGGKQYVVSEGQELLVDLLEGDSKDISFDVLSVIDGSKTTVGAPLLSGVKVSAEVISANEKADKVTAIRYKAKKRVKKVRGHRQQHARVRITKIA